MATDERSILSDPHRLASLRATGLLDSEPETSFDRYTRLAARLLDADVALMALVTSDRQFFKSSVGLPPSLRQARQTPLALSLCKHAVTRQAPLVLDDLTEDPVEEAAAVIERFDLRSYAGVPLVTADGSCVGSFSVLDREPRRWSEEEVEILGDLAAAVTSEIDLRRRQAEFRQLLADAPIPLAVHSADGFHYVNEEAVRLLGVTSAGALRGTPALELVHPDDRPKVRERVRRVLEERKPVPTEQFRLLRPDGRLLHIEARSIPVVHEGRPAVQTVVRDVTDELEARRRLEDVEKRQRLLLEQLPAVLWTVDRDLVFTSSTGSGLEGLGLERGEAVGMSLRQFFGTEDDDFLPIRRHREALSGRACNYRLDWRGRTYENHLEPLLSEDGEIIGVIGSAFDVTDRVEAERDQRRTEEQYQRLLELAPIGMFVDRAGEILYVNTAGAELLGTDDPSAIVGEPVSRFSDPTRRAEIRERIRRVEEEGKATDLEVFPLRTLDGEERLLEIKAIPVDYRGERASLSIARDVTDRVEAKRALRASEERYRRIFEDSKDVIYITDRDGSMAAVNPAGEELFGYPREELEGMNVARLYHDPHDRQQFQRAIESRGYVDDFEVQVETREGEVRECLITATVRTDDAGEVIGYQGILRDVTERKRFEEELERRALHDPLTGLPNRTLFFDRLEQAVARAERTDGRIAVLFVDLDRFKTVNDSLGHAAGDQVLVEVAARLQTAVREPDTVARVGGDEFTVLLEGLEAPEDAEDVARRITRGMRVPFAGGGEEVHLTCSIGLAHMSVEDGRPTPELEAAESLVRQADAAMFRSKDRPATRLTTYDPELDVAETARIQRENELRKALEREQFLLHYQPVVSLETGEILGVEPLVRWEHPDRGRLLPGEFLPLAEESGLILPLGSWILREACSQMAAWNDGALPGLRLSPNLSAAQFEDPRLTGLVEELLAEFDLPPERLQLEVTEHLVMRAPERTRQLAGLGVRIAIDDFGTGYSSLSYVRDLEVDTLKIDRSFVAGLGRSRQDGAIVKTILTLGATLDLGVVAEGVETGDQLRWLREAGCPAAQGYHLARPRPADAMGRMLAETPRLDLS